MGDAFAGIGFVRCARRFDAGPSLGEFGEARALLRESEDQPGLLGCAASFDDEAGGAAVFGDEFGGRAVGLEFAGCDDEDAGADLLDLGEDVGGDEHGAVGAEFADERAHLGDLGGVESVGGLVEDEDLGIVQDGRGEADALPVALAEVSDAAGADIAEPAAFDGSVDGGAASGSVEGVEPGAEGEVVRHTHFRIEGGGFGEISQFGACGEGLVEGVVGADAGVSGVRGDHAGEDSDGGGLACAVGSEQSGDLPRVEFEGDATKGVHASVPFMHAIKSNHADDEGTVRRAFCRVGQNSAPPSPRAG